MLISDVALKTSMSFGTRVKVYSFSSSVLTAEASAHRKDGQLWFEAVNSHGSSTASAHKQNGWQRLKDGAVLSCEVPGLAPGWWSEVGGKRVCKDRASRPGGRFVPSVRACAQCYSCQMRVQPPSLFPLCTGMGAFPFSLQDLSVGDWLSKSEQI